MKPFLYILLCVLLIVVLSGCDDKPVDIPAESTPAAAAPFMPEMSYTPIDSDFLTGAYIGKEVSALTVPPENVFINSEKMVGYDYVSLCEVQGNLSVYVDNGQITSYVFGSTPFKDKEQFRESFDAVNQKVAELLSVDKAETVFVGQLDDGDEVDTVFAGNGILKAKYQQDGYSVSVSCCGVSEAATVIVECSGER